MGGEDIAKINGGTWFRGIFTRNISHKKFTWTSPGKTQNKTNHTLTDKRWHLHVHDV